MDGIKLENITYTYPGASQPVLKKLNLQLPRGQWTTLIGKNGSGKSTIARLIDGLLVADEGQVVVNGLTVTEDHLTTLHRQVEIVFQNPDNQFVGATVADDIAFGLENQQLPRDEMTRRIDKALARTEPPLWGTETAGGDCRDSRLRTPGDYPGRGHFNARPGWPADRAKSPGPVAAGGVTDYYYNYP